MDTTYSKGERPFTPTYGGSKENLRKSYMSGMGILPVLATALQEV